MKEIFSCESINILAALGPCIGPCCLEVDSPVEKFFAENSLPWELVSRPLGKGKWSLDLQQANAYLLETEGVRRENIQRLNFCTSCRRDLFYSYRNGDQAQGRQLNFIALKEGVFGS
jgi:copper oxidase (laccase) domain-containing protein